VRCRGGCADNNRPPWQHKLARRARDESPASRSRQPAACILESRANRETVSATEVDVVACISRKASVVTTKVRQKLGCNSGSYPGKVGRISAASNTFQEDWRRMPPLYCLVLRGWVHNHCAVGRIGCTVGNEDIGSGAGRACCSDAKFNPSHIDSLFLLQVATSVQCALRGGQCFLIGRVASNDDQVSC
jgi:hypothetical protein